MILNKKLIFIGPPGTGKTTLKKIFFEKGDPDQLLNNPLNPSRGITTGIYSLFHSNIGIFDLAGQENEDWFSYKSTEVFDRSNMIICIFDVKNSLESIISFLLKIYKIKKDLNLSDCRIISFINKIDLVSLSYIEKKIRAIKSFIIMQHPGGSEFEVYRTSIKDNFLYDTFYILSTIMYSIYSIEFKSFKKSELNNLKDEVKVILDINNSFIYSLNELNQKSKFKKEQIKIFLKNLVNLGFISVKDDFTFITLTDRGEKFKLGLIKEFSERNEESFEKCLEIFYILISLYGNN